MIIAVDPGIHGAIALNDWSTGRLDVIRMPTQQRQIGARKLRTIIDEGEVVSTIALYAAMGATHLFIEQVGGLPGQSAPAAFTFGQGYGTVRAAAIAANLVIEAVPPALWKKALKVPSLKAGARARASELLPTHRHQWPKAMDDGIAEAALLSLYGQRWIQGSFTPERTADDEAQVVRAREARADADKRRRERIDAREAARAAAAK